MIHPTALPEALSEAVSPGVRLAALLTRSGMPIGIAGSESERAATQITAIVSTLYHAHEKTPADANCGPLATLVIDCAEGRLAIKRVASFIICVAADTSVPFGLLKNKVEALHDFLQQKSQLHQTRLS